MGLLDDMGGKFQEVMKLSGEVCKQAAKKSGDLLEIGRLRLKIQEEKSNIKAEHQELGKMIVDKYLSMPMEQIPEEYQPFVEMVLEYQKNIDTMLDRITEIKEANDDLTEEDFAAFDEDVKKAAQKEGLWAEPQKQAAEPAKEPVEVVDFGISMEETPREVVQGGVSLTKEDNTPEEAK